MVLVPSIVPGELHVPDEYERAWPSPSTAMQNEVVGQDTLSRAWLSLEVGVPHVPVNGITLPLLSTAIQKLAVTHEIEFIPIVPSTAVGVPQLRFQATAWPAPPTAMQKPVATHDTLLIFRVPSMLVKLDHPPRPSIIA